MANPRSRQEVKDYILRELGEPVTKVNMAEEQLDDRVDEALRFIAEYYFDGFDSIICPYQLTQDDIDNKRIILNELMIAVTYVHPLDNNIVGDEAFFNVEYHYRIDNWNLFYRPGVQYTGAAFYDQVNRWFEMLNQILRSPVSFRHNRHTDTLYLDIDWSKVSAGDYIVIEGYWAIDPETYNDLYSDYWFLKYAVALTKKQWAQNMVKYSGVNLPGGVQLDATRMLDEAKTDIEQIENRIIVDLSPPLDFFTG